MKITLHLVWLQADRYVSGKKLVPKRIKDNYQKWLDLNKEHDISLKTYTENDVLRYILSNFGRDMLEVYTKLMKVRYTEHFRCDLFRLLVLFLEGGLYIDVDQQPLAPLHKIGLNDSIDFMSISCGHDIKSAERRFSNAFIYVRRPGSEFLLRCIENYTKRILETPVSHLGLPKLISGTYLMGDTYRSMFNNQVLDKGMSDHNGEKWLFLNSIMGKKRHECKNNIEFWCSFHVVNLKGEKVMNERYKEYYEDKGIKDPKHLTNF